MKRLTYKGKELPRISDNSGEYVEAYCDYDVREIINRLSAIEDVLEEDYIANLINRDKAVSCMESVVNHGENVDGEWEYEANLVCPRCKCVVGDAEYNELTFDFCPNCGQRLKVSSHVYNFDDINGMLECEDYSNKRTKKLSEFASVIEQLRYVREHCKFLIQCDPRDSNLKTDLSVLSQSISILKRLGERKQLTIEELKSLEGSIVYASYENPRSTSKLGYWCICDKGVLLTPSKIYMTVTEDLINEGWKYYLSGI